MSTNEAPVLIEETIATEIVEKLLADTFDIIEEKFYKLQGVAMYQNCFMQALQDLLYVYDKPKPCNDHSHIIEAWKRDKPATPSMPDSLMRDLFKKAWNDEKNFLKSEIETKNIKKGNKFMQQNSEKIANVLWTCE